MIEMRLCGLAAVLLFLLAGVASAAGPATVTVQSHRIVEADPGRKLGLNLNIFTDGELAEASFDDLAATLRRMGVRWLRYPGGEKSDGVRWAFPPYDRPEPAPLREDVWPGNDPGLWRTPLGFDRFIELCRAVGAEPIVVVAYDSAYPASPSSHGPSREELIEMAAAWVKYANVTRGYRVRYWEIGNESYGTSYNGGATARQYAADYHAFAEAMKAVDDSILVGANGPGDVDGRTQRAGRRAEPAWWPHLIGRHRQRVDFVSLHHYPGWGWNGYDAYPARWAQLDDIAGTASRLAERFRAAGRWRRVPALVTEYNVHDWSPGGWPANNDLGHALALAEGLGRLLASPAVDAALVWNTRWVESDRPHPLFDVFDASLNLRPTGEALAAWARMTAGGAAMVACGSDDGAIAAFACRDPDGVAHRVLLVNRGHAVRPVRLRFAQGGGRLAGAATFTAGSPQSVAPRWRPLVGRPVLRLPPTSLTLVEIRRAGTP